MKTTLALIFSVLLSSAALAQPAPPPPPREGGGGGPPDRGDRRDDRPGPRDGRPGGPGGFGGMSPSEMEPRMRQFEFLRGYLELVDRYAHLARDPSMSGIAAVISAGDILKPRGADAAIDYYTKLLPEVKSPGVQRAIRLQLVDLYKAAG